MATSSTVPNGAVLRPLVCCGPSGAGKGTLIGRLLQDNPDCCGFSVSHTTRGPRKGEVNGQHYHFCSLEQMEADIAKGIFLEHAKVHGNRYGTSFTAVQTVEDNGRLCVLDIDVQGVKLIKAQESESMQPHYVFIAPPSMEVLEQRLRHRGTETEDAVKLRISNAAEELRFGTESGYFEKTIVNDDVDTAYRQLVDLVKDWYPQYRFVAKPQVLAPC